ncbi:MAG: acyl-CoA dehydratase activase-related protein [Candidatus Paceibacterales bacterium]
MDKNITNKNSRKFVANSQKFARPKVTFARWGNYTIAFKTLFEELGLEVVPPEKTNSQTIAEGAKLAPEMYCFPLKVNIGNYLETIRRGADTIFMATALGGSCRLRYYGVVQDKVLKEAGYEVNFVIFDQGLKDIYSKLKEISAASPWQVFKAARFFFKKLRFIEGLEKKVQYLRPREIKEGMTDKLLIEALVELDKVEKEKDFSKFKRETLRRFSEIKIEKNKNLPKVGLIGEIYTVSDPIINFEVERKLGQEGIEVHREMDLTYHLKKKIFFWKDWVIQRKINPYLKSTVGGHGRDAIYEMLDYIEKGFDGVIHLLPMACMPEVTVRPILERIHRESGVPFLSLSLDEQVAEAGINTRLEAFVDVVKNYHQRHDANMRI